ncbi:MAG: sulfatase-like hydrolase/transferase [Candidatus Nealsonbacteria bacterium]|nr:sulfatase-like hydrolase/transferase [Candidatus Nealsonbacteria bacterium]
MVTTSAIAAERPNVILIFADDQGTLDLNCYGSTDLYTPNLDGLARRGVRFTQFYVAAPVCSPSRAALLTGRFPQRAGVPGNVSSHPGHEGMPTEQVTVAEVLRGAGYRTAAVGKWHLGTTAECSPCGQGFDEFFGHKAGCIDNLSHFFYWVPPHFHDLHRNNKEVYEEGQHFTRLMAREARRFIEESKDKPFFLYLAFNIPHYPLQAYAEYREMFAAKKKMTWQRQQYAAWTATMDDGVGEVLAKVDELKLREKTLVIFLSDHGHSIESRANGGGGNAGPYRGNKFTLWEGGLRVPCIASLPGRIPQGETRDQMGVSVDWLPTICRYCDVDVPKRILDGKNLMPVIDSAAEPTPHEVFHWQSGSQWAVRRGDWKLVAERRKTPGAPPALLLSNMTEDVTETKSLAGKHPEIVKELSDLHAKWVKEVGK